MRDANKQKYIKLFKSSVENTDRVLNNPDHIFFIEHYDYDSGNAYPFLYFRFDNEAISSKHNYKNQVYYGPQSGTHYAILPFLHQDLMKKGFKPSDISGCKFDDDLENAVTKKGAYIDTFDTDLVIKGRYFLVDVPEINQQCVIFSFWFPSRFSSELLYDIVYQVCAEKKLFDRRIYITNNSQPLIYFNEFNPGPSEETEPISDYDDTQDMILHMLPGSKKWKATKPFRDMRDRKLGRKLTMSNGQEMPMARYNALRYVDESATEQTEQLPEEMMNERHFYNTPDRVSIALPNEHLEFNVNFFTWKSDIAKPLTYLTYNGENRLFVGEPGENHRELKITKIRDYFSKYLGEEAWYKYYLLVSPLKRDGLEHVNIDGRVWANIRLESCPNRICTIFAFWEADANIISKIVEIAARELNLINTDIYIANLVKPYILFHAGSPITAKIEDNSREHVLHLRDPRQKWLATKDFRDSRDQQLGRRLTMSNGQEMTMAQYNALRYVDESATKPKRIVYMTESQVAEIKRKLQQARKETNTNPTEKQKEAGNYKMGRVKILGFDIAIENPKGSIRKGKDKKGNAWQIKMNNDYGYFTHTKAIDGDAVDVFIGNKLTDNIHIFAIDQKINGKFDETKVMLGFETAQDAKEAYLSNYQKGWKGFWEITEVTLDVFKEWLYDGYKQRKPFFEYVDIQKKKLNENVDFYKKDELRLSGENISDYAHIVEEEIQEYKNNKTEKVLTKESLDELLSTNELKDVISSFDVQKELNPKFWVNGKLNSRVRLRLLDIADIFFDSLDVNWVKPKDIIMTGSLANYNWSKYSDIDLHILVDFKEVDERVEFVKSYFDSKKKIWNEEHEDLTIYGYPVELYVQDVNEEHSASGIYSLEKNEWIKEPVQDDLEAVELDKHTIADKTKKIADKIENLETACKKETDTEKLDILSDKVKKLFDKIKGMRKEALKHGGSELNTGNLIFKCLRRTGYISRLVDLKRVTFDKINTIK